MKQYQKISTETRLQRRPDRISGRADHQQALRQHPAGRADLHVQLGRGQHHPRTRLRAADKQAEIRTVPEAASRQARRQGSDRTEFPPLAERPAALRARPGRAKRQRPQASICETRKRDRPMLRFLAMRIASAIPVLVILSLVTFAIIQAPPGDYADYIRSQLINQGGASFDEADAQAAGLPRRARPRQAAAGPVSQLDRRHRHPRRFRLQPLLQQAGRPTWSASACRARCCWR